MLSSKKFLFSLLSLFLCVSSFALGQTSALKDYSRIDKKYSKETSGIVKSRITNDLFWILDDSGNDDRIYAIRRNGDSYVNENYKGQKIKGTGNRDWEDILVDDNGHVIIADIGNNCRCRKDLAFFILEETDPSVEKNDVRKEIRFTYPTINTLGIKRNTSFDAESAFFYDGSIYLLTKHGWLERKTMLYRVPPTDSTYAEVELEFIQEIRIDGSVTAADYDVEKKRLAILTYTSVWVYETGDDGALFSGKAFRKSIKADQVESITFDGDDLIIVDEVKGKMYLIPVSELDYVDFD